MRRFHLALLDVQNSIRDQLGWLEQRSRLLLRVGRMDDAAVAYRHVPWHNSRRKACIGMLPATATHVGKTGKRQSIGAEAFHSMHQGPPIAFPVCRELLASNADNYCYHEGLQAALNLQARGPNQHSAEHRQQLSKLYRELAADFPASKAVRRIPLDFLVWAPLGVALRPHAGPMHQNFYGNWLEVAVRP